MSTTCNQAVLSRTQVSAPLADLDLGITAINTTLVTIPYVAGAIDLRATKTIIGTAVTIPYVAGAIDLRATKTVLTVG